MDGRTEGQTAGFLQARANVTFRINETEKSEGFRILYIRRLGRSRCLWIRSLGTCAAELENTEELVKG